MPAQVYTVRPDTSERGGDVLRLFVEGGGVCERVIVPVVDFVEALRPLCVVDTDGVPLNMRRAVRAYVDRLPYALNKTPLPDC